MSLRVIARNLLRTPITTAIAAASLALGIGGNAAMFSVLDQIVLRTLPANEPERLVLLYAPGPVQGSSSTDEDGGPSFTMPTYRGMAKTQTPFTGLAAARGFGASVSYRNDPRRESIHLVSGNYFEVLGVRAALGRVLGPADDLTPGGHPVAVLNHRFWTSKLGASPAALNATILVNGHPMTIVGVARPGFDSEKQGSNPALYVPLSMRAQMVPGRDPTNDRRSHWLPMFGRLKPGQTLETARVAIQAAYATEKEEEIRALRGPEPAFTARYRAKQVVLKDGAHGRGQIRAQAATPLALLLGITGAVLLIACANVANLLLARSAARAREMALRVALGASRGRIVRQLLAESWLLSGVSGLLGLVVAWVVLKLIGAGIPPSSGVEIDPRLNPTVLLFCMALSVFTGVAFGLFPALQAARPDVVAALKDQAGQSSATGAANRFRRILVTSQMAASLALLIAAGLFGKSLLNLTRIDLGIRTDHLVTFALDPRLNKYDADRTLALYEQLEQRLAALPGAQLVSSSVVPAIAGDNWGQSVNVPGFTRAREDEDHSFYNITGPGYLRTMGSPLLAGREFTEADNRASAKVVIVNEAFLRRFFPNEKNPAAAAGRMIGLGSDKPDHAIVGVMKDTNYSEIKEAPKPVFHQPYRQASGQNGMTFYVRTAVPPETLMPRVRQVVASLDPNLPVAGLKTMRAQLDENLFAERLLSVNIAVFAGLATLLAAVGLYGVLAYSVARRTREIGIRMALGAEAAAMRAMVLGDVLKMLAVGSVVGAAAGWAISRVAGGLLFGLAGAEPLVYVAAAAVLGAVAMAAAWIPALRATRVDPLRALRYE